MRRQKAEKNLKNSYWKLFPENHGCLKMEMVIL